MKLRGLISLRKLLPICAMPKGSLTRPGVDDVLEVGEDPLRRLGPQVGDVRLALERPDERLEHQVERAGLGQRAALVGRRADDLLAIRRRRAAGKG